VWVDISRAMNAAPNSEESRRAIEEIRRFIGSEHEDFMEAIVIGTMMLEAMRGLSSWVNKDPYAAGYAILTALIKHLGKLIGEILSDLSQASTPWEIGEVLGALTGSILIEAARFYLGI